MFIATLTSSPLYDCKRLACFSSPLKKAVALPDLTEGSPSYVCGYSQEPFINYQSKKRKRKKDLPHSSFFQVVRASQELDLLLHPHDYKQSLVRFLWELKKESQDCLPINKKAFIGEFKVMMILCTEQKERASLVWNTTQKSHCQVPFVKFSWSDRRCVSIKKEFRW